MASFIRQLKELQFSVEALWVIHIVLNTGIIYLGAYLLLSLFTFIPAYSIFPASAYFLTAVYVKIRRPKLNVVENKYSSLKEKLRTAFQYKNSSNPILDELKREVSSELKKVELASLINTKAMTRRVLVMLFLVFSLMFVSFISSDLLPFKYAIRDSVENVPSFISEQFRALESGTLEAIESSLHGESLVNDKEGFGKVSDEVIKEENVAELGDKTIDLVINDFGFELDFSKEEDYDSEVFGKEVPVSLFAESQESFKEKIDDDEKIVVRNYFEAINQ